MVKQYPHIASVIITSDSGADAKGYPLPPGENIVTLICRAEPNSSNSIVYTNDGTAYNFKHVVYIQKGQLDIPVGSRVTVISDSLSGQIIFSDDGQALNTDNSSFIVTNDGRISSSGLVKMYSKGQFNQRLWL